MAEMTHGKMQGVQARAQFAAMAQMHWRMFVNGLRSIHGLLDLGATGVAWTFYAIIGLGMGTGLAAAGHALAQQGAWQRMPILFWAASFIWLVLPVVAASYEDRSNLGILLRFPVRFSSYIALYLISALMEASTIVGLLCCFGIWLGIVLVRPQAAFQLALVLVVFAAFNVLLVLAVFAWIERWLAQRKSREILGAVLMALFLAAQFFNPALYQHRSQGSSSQAERRDQKQEDRARYRPMLKAAELAQQWLAPGSAARAAQQIVQGRPVPAMAWLGLLGIWTLAAGGVLGLRLKAEYRGESLGWAPARSQVARAERVWTLGGSGTCSAVLEKEVQALRRSPPLLWAVGAPLLLVLVIAGLFQPSASGHSFPYAVPLCVAYALLGFTRLFYNNLGTEGAAIQLLFVSPTPLRTVLLGKNLLHGVLFLLVGCAAVALGCLRLATPPAAVMAALGAWLLFALPCNLAAGNILSLTMPYRMNPGRISRPPGSQANALTAMAIQAGTLAIGGAILSLCWSLGKPWWAVPILLAFAVAACFIWKKLLIHAEAMAFERREELIDTMMNSA